MGSSMNRVPFGFGGPSYKGAVLYRGPKKGYFKSESWSYPHGSESWARQEGSLMQRSTA